MGLRPRTGVPARRLGWLAVVLATALAAPSVQAQVVQAEADRAEDGKSTKKHVRGGVSLAFARTFGQWRREYEWHHVAPGQEVYFLGRLPENIWGWRGRLDIQLTLPQRLGIYKFSPWVEVADPISHAVVIAGRTMAFEANNTFVGLQFGPEFRFLHDVVLLGLNSGVASTIESTRAIVPAELTVIPTSIRFSVMAQVVLGFRIPLPENFYVGATGSAEYHLFTNATRFAGGGFLEWQPKN